MTSGTSGIMERMMMVRRILDGLTPEQADQAGLVLARTTNHELSAIHDRRGSYSLGAALPPLR